MSTIKSSAENLTLNADGANNDIKFQSNGSEVASIDQAGVIVSAGGSTHADNVKAKFGTGNDLEIYHTGTHSYIADAGTGQLKIITNGTGLDIQKDETETMAKFITDGAVKLYHNNAEKLETTAAGVTITGALTETDSAAGSVLQIVPFTSSTATNVTTSGTWTTIAASSVAITSKQANSKFLYYFDMSVETDVSAISTYNFGMIARSGTRINASQQTLPVGHDSYESSPTTVFTYTDVPSAAAGTTYTYTVQLNAQNSASFQINQPSLSGQEGGTAIHSNGYVMEIAV